VELFRKRIDLLREKLDELGIDSFLTIDPVNIGYICGFSGSPAALVISKGLPSLLVPRRDEEQAGREVGGLVEVIAVEGSVLEEAYGFLKKKGVRSVGMEADKISHSEWRKGSWRMRGIRRVICKGVVEGMRMRKSPEEIDAIRGASRVSVEVFGAITGFLSPDMSEMDLAAEIEYRMRRGYKARAAFDTIVAYGPNSAIPHAIPTDRVPGEGDSIKIDLGAKLHGYCSDMTRTIFWGRPSEEMKKVYGIVLEAQLSAIDAVRSGVKAKDVDLAARSIIERAGYGGMFVHPTGHGIGRAVHEGPSIWKKEDTVLETGMVITIEPGIYIPGLGGVRIEDTVLVRDDGAEVLTGDAGKDMLVLA
jgi:Xaa-Pro aminopeptidase